MTDWDGVIEPNRKETRITLHTGRDRCAFDTIDVVFGGKLKISRGDTTTANWYELRTSPHELKNVTDEFSILSSTQKWKFPSFLKRPRACPVESITMRFDDDHRLQFIQIERMNGKGGVYYPEVPPRDSVLPPSHYKSWAFQNKPHRVPDVPSTQEQPWFYLTVSAW